MIAFLRGVVEYIGYDSVGIDVAGVGYGVQMNIRDVASLKKGQDVNLLISEIIREQSFDLYGFTDVKDKNFFDLILKVSGVGPRIALALVGMATIEEIASAIKTSNIAILTSAPGVGKKLAERIVVELRDKINTDLAVSSEKFTSISAQAEEALLALGFKQADAQAMLKNVDASLPVSEQVRAALKGK